MSAPLKLYCVVAQDSLKKMNGVRGKLASQAGHAFLHAWWDAETRFPDAARTYREGRAYKVTLVVPDVAALHALRRAYETRCGTALVTDQGLTVFTEPTTTCLGLGPISDDDLQDDLRSLKVLT